MVVLTELTTEATLFNTLYSEYATPHMLDAIRAVEDFSHTTKLNPKQIICKGNKEQLWDNKFDHEWQRLFHWYQKVVYFHRMNLLSDKFYSEFPGKMRTKHFVEHVEPFAINACESLQQTNCSEIFDYLRTLYQLPARQVITCDQAKKTTTNKIKTNDEL